MIGRFLGAIGLAGCLAANAGTKNPVHPSDIEIDGRVLGSAELVSLQSRLGVRVGAGRYLMDPRSGCWLNITTGWTGCIGDPELHPWRGERGAHDRRDD